MSTLHFSAQDLILGHGDVLNPHSPVDVQERGGRGGGPAHDGPRQVDDELLRTADLDRLLASAGASMQMYLLLEGRATVPRADSGLQEVLAANFAQELTTSTRAGGESLDDLLADRSAFADVPADAAGQLGCGNVPLSQLAGQHQLGAR